MIELLIILALTYMVALFVGVTVEEVFPKAFGGLDPVLVIHFMLFIACVLIKVFYFNESS